MRLTVFCKASSHIGLGHLIRSYSFVNQVLDSNPIIKSVNYYLIGDSKLSKLLNNPKVNVYCKPLETDIKSIEDCDVVVLDMLDLSEEILQIIKQKTRKIALLSPIFNHMDLMDYYFGRTKYLNFDPENYPNLKVYAGLEYAIIQKNCKQISSGIFEENLKTDNLPIAISMGGGDAFNKTLDVLKVLKQCKVKATFWVMIGEGYKHSFDELIDEIRNDTSHEIILAKTNNSMWNILKNCVLCILPGGITSFEAVYAGLPTINFFDQESQQFLLQEIVEHNAAYDFGIYSESTLQSISNFIENIQNSKKELLQMHVNTKFLIDGQGSKRIFSILNTPN